MAKKILIEKDIEQGNFKKGGEASSSLKTKLGKLGIDPAIIRKASIVTYELEMNVIIHSCGGHIKVEIDSEKLIINVEDKGPGIMNLKKAFEPGFSTAGREIREMGFGAGMGLNNVKKYTSDLNVRTDVDKGTEIMAIILLEV